MMTVKLPDEFSFYNPQTWFPTSPGGRIYAESEAITSSLTAPIVNDGTTYDASKQPGNVAALLYAVSSNSSDNAIITMIGIDQDGKRREVSATLNGTTPVAFTGLWQYVEYFWLNSAAAGNVSIQDKDANPIITLSSGAVKARIGHLYTGIGQRFMITRFVAKLGALRGNAMVAMLYATNQVLSKDISGNIGSMFPLDSIYLFDTEAVVEDRIDYMPQPLIIPPSSYLCMIATGEGDNDEHVVGMAFGRMILE